MPIQAPQWTEFLSCPVCYNVFNEKQNRPISLACGHTVCKLCLSKLQQRKCPFDQSLISREIGELPVNFALLQLVCATAIPEDKEEAIPKDCHKHYEAAKLFIEELALLLKPVSSASTGSIIPTSSVASGSASSNTPNCVLSRPMQRKLITLVNCQLVEEEGRSRAVRAARSLGERTVTELILQHQNPQQLSSNLWAAVRGRGCQFLGPAMQEEVLHLILLALEDGSALSRKVLVLFVVQRLEAQYPQASKTAIGHVVQLLYRASCFKVTKRDQESSLMQLKEDFRSYETLRREHDTQIVQIAMEAGLRIAPDQWSSLLYGDSTHKSHMQSIIDKLQTPQTFGQSVSELLIALQRTGDPHSLQRLRPELEFLSSIDPSPDVPCPSWENLEGVLHAAKTVIEGLVSFLQNSGHKKHDFLSPFNNVRYKTSMCRDFAETRSCPRGVSCTFAHSEEELERYRQRNKKAAKGPLGLPGVPMGRGGPVPVPTHTVPTHRQGKDHLAPRLTQDRGDGVVSHNAPLPLSNTTRSYSSLVEANQRGPRQDPGIPHTGHGAPAPSVAKVAPNAHSQPPTQGSRQPLPSDQDQASPTLSEGQASSQGSDDQATPQGSYQAQGPPSMPAFPPWGSGAPGYSMGSPRPGYPGQMPPDAKGMPPYMPPYYYDFMRNPGGHMGPPPMNPMMYMYPGMHPYMPYYHPGYMHPGGMRYPHPHFGGYRPQLNPHAEPWSPSQEQFCYDYMAMAGLPPHEPPTSVAQQNSQNANTTPGQSQAHTSRASVQTSRSEQQTVAIKQEPLEGENTPVSRSRASIQTSRSNQTSQECSTSDTQRSRGHNQTSRSVQQTTSTYQEGNSSDCWSTSAYQTPTSILQRPRVDPATSVLQRSINDLQTSLAFLQMSRGDRGDIELDSVDLPTSTTELQPPRITLHDSIKDLTRPPKVSTASVSMVMTPTKRQQTPDTVEASGQMQTTKTTRVPDAVIQRQSLSSLQERRNSLLNILKERQRTNSTISDEDFDESYPKMNSYQDLVERMKKQGSYHGDPGGKEETLRHPVPRDSGPQGLKAAHPTHTNLFKRLGAISGMPPRSVNDSIMASWMTATLTAASSKNTSNVATTSQAPILNERQSNYNNQPSADCSIVSSLSQGPIFSGSYSSYGSHASYNIQQSADCIVSSLSQTRDYSSSPVSDGWNSPKSQQNSLNKKQENSVETNWTVSEEDFPYWQDISRTMDSPSPVPYSMPAQSQNTMETPYSSFSQIEIHPSIANFFRQMEQEQEDVIPFDSVPIISKFGPISRLKTKGNNTVPLKVMADEMMKTVPVTVVTPLTRSPLPNATTVPSRFTPVLPSSVDSVPVALNGAEVPEPECYSLWKKEVVQLERKAQEANTVDEQLNIQLQAVEMQISMKQQELQEVHDVQYVQRQASEYIRHRHTLPQQEDWPHHSEGHTNSRPY